MSESPDKSKIASLLIGKEAKALHPITCLNPSLTFSIFDAKIVDNRILVRGEETCWWGQDSWELVPSAIRDNLDRAERVLKAWADWNGPVVEDDAFSMQEQAKKYFALKNEAPQEQDEGLQHGGAERATGCSSAAHVEAASQAPSVPSPPAVASPPANWWCPTCRRSLVPSEVTYEECHDSRTGGCGMPVSTSELPSSEKDRKRLIDNAISDLAQLYGLIEEGEYDKASDYCKAAAEWYTQEIASLAALPRSIHPS